MALENGPADETILPHVTKLAQQFKSELLLLHVADGFAARNFDQLKLNESEEIKRDREYLETVAEEIRKHGIRVATFLAMGSPPKEILKAAEDSQCDLIAMTTHGHRWLADLVFGSTISEVRHKTSIPLLLLRAAK